jgi:hypothetical protein
VGACTVQYVQLFQSIGSAGGGKYYAASSYSTLSRTGDVEHDSGANRTKKLGESGARRYWKGALDLLVVDQLREWNAGIRGEVGFSCKYDPGKSIRI